MTCSGRRDGQPAARWSAARSSPSHCETWRPAAHQAVVGEGRSIERRLHLARHCVAEFVQVGQRALHVLVGHVTVARALEPSRRRGQRVGPELPDTRVELLVAAPQRPDRGGRESGVGLRQDLGDDPAVGLVVVLETREVHQGRPDVGLVHPRAGGAAARDGDLAAVRPGRVGPGARRRTVETRGSSPPVRRGPGSSCRSLPRSHRGPTRSWC